MRIKIIKYVSIILVLFCGLLFVAKFGGPALLRAYIKSGIGDCDTLPLLCILPENQIDNPQPDKVYLQTLVPYYFPDKLLPYPLPAMNVSIPKGFTVIRGNITKVYYKRKKYSHKEPTIYLLYQKPKFFVNLFPQLKKEGIDDNYKFLNRVMTAKFINVASITDAFFVIMKSIFIPDLGDQKNIKILRFLMGGRRGFVSYNLGSSENYFNCDIVTKDDAFFKIYIKDRARKLDINDVLAIISTMGLSNISVR